VKGMWTQGEESFKAAWNNPNPEEKWKFFGKIVGMILFEVVLAILTAGAGLALNAAAKSSALVAKLPKLVKVIDALTPDLKKVPDVDRDKLVRKGIDADVRTKKVDEIKAEQPDYVKKTDVDAEADARKRGESELDKNDPEFEDKLEAFVQAVVITEAADLVDEPVAALVLTLDKLIGSRFKVDFKYLRTGVDEFDVLMNPKVKKKYTGPERGESKNGKDEKEQTKSSHIFEDYNQARNAAIEWLEQRGFKAETETLGRFGDTKGKPIGMQTSDGKKGFRVEFDDRNGAHINVWNGKEKGPHFLFKGTKEDVIKIQSNFQK
jgi:hypothetical protein